MRVMALLAANVRPPLPVTPLRAANKAPMLIGDLVLIPSFFPLEYNSSLKDTPPRHRRLVTLPRTLHLPFPDSWRLTYCQPP